MTPRREFRGATSSDAWSVGRRDFGKRTIGAAAERSAASAAAVTRQNFRTTATLSHIKAKGLAGRCLRLRSRFTARALVASQASWNPPRLLIATILPFSRASAAASRGDSFALAGATARLGPQTGQAMGWAWWRRLAGSMYSRRHCGHIGKPAIVVPGRS